VANEHVLAAIKAAMKAEIDGVTTYESAAGEAERAGAPEVRDFLLERAGEEKAHFNWLLEYYREISSGASPERDLAQDGEPASSPIFGPDFLRRVGQSRQLSAAISTAILLEADAIRHYRTCAEETVQAPLRAFYERLAEWEDRHYHDLLSIQEESERFFWDANNWRPF
jgi:rubrerythrin